MSLAEIESRRQDIAIDFLNNLDMYAFYFLKGTLNPMLNEYFMGVFLIHWEDLGFQKYIKRAREGKPSAYSHLEKLAYLVKNKKEESHG